jgi:hypothetical protein
MSNQIKAWQGGTCDADAELDECDSEPSLGSIEMHPNPYETMADHLRTQELWAIGATNDAEGDEHDGREPEDDSEPSLGSFDGLVDQHAAWTASALQCDSEPSLGWTIEGQHGERNDHEMTGGEL